MVEQPDLVEKKDAGLFCFMDSARPCGPDCMAYLNPPPQDPDYQGQQWSSCLLLVNAHRTGKHLVILTADVHKLAEKIRTAASPVSHIPPPQTR